MERPTTRDQAGPLDTPAPTFSLEEAAEFSERYFGLAGSASALDSERDQNFRIESEEGHSYLLKVSNAADDPAVVEMQTAALLHIAQVDPGLPVMRPRPALDGAYAAEVEVGDGTKLLVRLSTFLPGEMLEASDLEPAEIREVGSVVARMGIALRGFFHPAGGYKILWDLKYTPDLRPLLGAVENAERRAIVERVLDRFDERVAPELPKLRSQMIHDDLTLSNVLLDDEHRVSGIVDFGDLTHTALICDLGNALVSVMWETSYPLVPARTLIGGYASVTPIEEGEADLLADLVGARLAALVLIARWRVQRYPENAAYITANEDQAWRLLELLDAMSWDEVHKQLKDACLRLEPQRTSRPPKEDLMERRRQVLGPALAPLSYERPLYLVRGEGSHLFDDEGRAYLDAYNNVPVVGHCHPRVTAAIAEQSATLNTNTRYLHESAVELAERLVATLPPELDTVLFYNSGSEANDIAWRLATAYTGGAGAIVTSFAYHGVTTGTIALSPEEWVAGETPGYVERIPAPGYRENERCGAHIDAAVVRLEGRGTRLAAFYADALFTSDGIFTPPPGCLQEVVARVHHAGGLYVADEVQCGYGRTGGNLWGFQGADITPDFVTLGKPMGNGFPVAAVVTRREIAERFASKIDVFSTFGGNPVACRAALAVLDVIKDEGLQARAKDVGSYLRTKLTGLKDAHGAVGDVRGAGLLIGVELVGDRETLEPVSDLARAVMNGMRERGVLIGTTGPHGNVLKIRPPLVLTTREADVIVETLDLSLTDCRHA